MIEQLPSDSPRILAFRLSGTLHDEDYARFVPVVEAALTGTGTLRLLAHFDDFHGWDVHAAWDDFLFGVRHYGDFERIALVGDRAWEAWMAQLCKPFTRATVNYFDTSRLEAAWAWLREGG